MITRIRDVRKARGLTLEEVAARCVPPTTAQTIGRLETGTRTVSVKWLNRIADALDVQAADLVDLPQSETVPVAALVGPEGAGAPSRTLTLVPPSVPKGAIGIRMTAALGDYRAGDELWCTSLAPEHFAEALNRDVLVPRPAGRFLFGRLIGRDGSKLHLLPLGPGSRQQVVSDPPWIALPVRLIRAL
ncbi:MAG: helix-turn-helix transcriptional regulator [Sphingobium sp.]|nr:helix-turn-helix transcriptional regulator [Sphingobium sp.]